MGKRDFRLFLILLTLLYVFLILRNAWISDDIFITFRTIENFLSGYGLTFNSYVRVQSFTHPLWVFLLSAVYLIFNRLHLTFGSGLFFPTILLSVLLSTTTVLFATTKVVKRDLTSLLLFFAPVIFSRAFIDYSTSGLENSLTHFLLILYLWLLFKDSPSILSLAFVSALIGFNRIDALLLIIPSLFYVLLVERKKILKNIMPLFLGFLPLILWELFSLFYYGFPFPNTAYAKLNTGIPSMVMVEQGLDYLLNSLNMDPLTLFVISLSGIGVALTKDRKSIVSFLGVMLYLIYVLSIGGDFMSGRFLTSSLLISAILISRTEYFSLHSGLPVLITFFLLGVLTIHSTLLDPLFPLQMVNYSVWDKNEIADERLAYFERHDQGLIVSGFRDTAVSSNIFGSNWKITGNYQVKEEDILGGRTSYLAGPDVYFMDQTALADPLLARLPVLDTDHWRIGHFIRKVPQGYKETLQTGTMKIIDPDLAIFYQKLSFVITGPLWNGERIGEIIKFNAGQYDYLLKSYLARSQH
jgi:arabinofuranosyltransferase